MKTLQDIAADAHHAHQKELRRLIGDCWTATHPFSTLSRIEQQAWEAAAAQVLAEAAALGCAPAQLAQPGLVSEGFEICGPNLRRVPLTAEQQAHLAPMFEAVRAANAAGDRRAVMAQVWRDGAVVRLLNSEQIDGVGRLLGAGSGTFASSAERMQHAIQEPGA